MAFAYCLDCGDRIYLGRKPWVGQEAFCERCGADMEVIRTNPLELEWTDDLVDTSPDREEALELESELLPA
jgi:lysine biosynthesis protein LysW